MRVCVCVCLCRVCGACVPLSGQLRLQRHAPSPHQDTPWLLTTPHCISTQLLIPPESKSADCPSPKRQRVDGAAGASHQSSPDLYSSARRPSRRVPAHVHAFAAAWGWWILPSLACYRRGASSDNGGVLDRAVTPTGPAAGADAPGTVVTKDTEDGSFKVSGMVQVGSRKLKYLVFSFRVLEFDFRSEQNSWLVCHEIRLSLLVVACPNITWPLRAEHVHPAPGPAAGAFATAFSSLALRRRSYLVRTSCETFCKDATNSGSVRSQLSQLRDLLKHCQYRGADNEDEQVRAVPQGGYGTGFSDEGFRDNLLGKSL